MYFLFQGAAPEKWMMEAGEYTMRRFAGLYGMTYIGMATDRSEAQKNVCNTVRRTYLNESKQDSNAWSCSSAWKHSIWKTSVS